MIHLMLDDLGGEILKGLDPDLKIRSLPADFDFAVAGALPGAAQQGQAAFLCGIGPALLQDLGIEHGGIAIALLEDDDVFGHADHIGGHTHTAFLVVDQSIQQIPGGIQVGGGGGGGFSGQQKGVVDQFSDHKNSSFRGVGIP